MIVSLFGIGVTLLRNVLVCCTMPLRHFQYHFSWHERFMLTKTMCTYRCHCLFVRRKQINWIDLQRKVIKIENTFFDLVSFSFKRQTVQWRSIKSITRQKMMSLREKLLKICIVLWICVEFLATIGKPEWRSFKITICDSVSFCSSTFCCFFLEQAIQKVQLKVSVKLNNSQAIFMSFVHCAQWKSNKVTAGQKDNHELKPVNLQLVNNFVKFPKEHPQIVNNTKVSRIRIDSNNQ